MKQQFKLSCQKQKRLTYILAAGSICVCLMSRAGTVSFDKRPQEERLSGTSLQSIQTVTPYYDSCHTIYDNSLYQGEVVVTQPGTAGSRKSTVLVTYLNGREISEDVIDTHVIVPAAAREVHIGTKERPRFILPVSNYTITSYVGPRWGRTHNGIDLAVTTGTPVRSSAAGTVIQSGWNGGYGISVYVDCGDGFILRYGHLSEAQVSVGQTVRQGEILGLSGNTGNSTGPHLHFEMRIRDEVVDPLEYLDF